MKVKDTDILIVPGRAACGPGHWQSRWQAKLSTARRVQPTRGAARQNWSAGVAGAVNAAEKPVVIIAHSLGVAATVHAVGDFVATVAGAFLVAPPDIGEGGSVASQAWGFGSYPRDPLPFPSITVASRNDPHCAFDIAEDIAAAWGSLFVDAGQAGHIDAEAGYGPWPEGSMAFAQFLSRL
jgi:predicted alpha/beta hydrolase family esterase